MLLDILIGALAGLLWASCAYVFGRFIDPTKTHLFHGSWSFYGALLAAAVFILTNGLVSALVALIVTMTLSLTHMLIQKREDKQREL